MLIPFILFWVLIFLGGEELGFKGVVLAIAAWAAMLAGCMAAPLHPLYFVAAQAGLDIALILTIFGGDIKISH